MTSPPLRVLLGHVYYRSSSPSGEDTVFHNERQLLEDAGIEVIPFIRHNDDLKDTDTASRLKIAMRAVWSAQSKKELRAMLLQTRPHLAHFHNTFPQISPSAYSACREAGVPVIQTLHNYRLVCVGALLQRNGAPCEDCLNNRPLIGLLPGVRHRCYRGSLPATAALTLMLAANRANGSYRGNVDSYIALTEFAASRLKAGGLPAHRFTVKPNFLPNPPAFCERPSSGSYAVYAGRLSEEKGVLTLLQAWRGMRNLPLRILGDGPLAESMRNIATEERLDVEFLGLRSKDDVLRIAAGAKLQIVPSEWYEGFPMVLLEAFACGTPVVVSQIGSLDELVEHGVTGVKFPPGNAAALADVVSSLAANDAMLATMRQNARAAFDRKFTAARNLEQLMAIYRRVLVRDIH